MFADLERPAQDHQRFRLRVEGGRDVLPLEGEDGHQQLERVQLVHVLGPGKTNGTAKHSKPDPEDLIRLKKELQRSL